MNELVITLSGTIGVGKTTWGGLIAKHFGVELLEESVDGNPFLAPYYENPHENAFKLQTYFLNDRFKKMKKACQHPNYVLDRSIYEDAMIFAKQQYENGYMSELEYNTYLDLFNNMMQEMIELYDASVLLKKSPDIMVHLHGSFDEILRRIEKRGRPFEQIEGNDELLQYYEDLYNKYVMFIEEYYLAGISPMYILNIDELDAENPEDVAAVMGDIEDMLRQTRGYAFPEELDKEETDYEQLTIDDILEAELKGDK